VLISYSQVLISYSAKNLSFLVSFLLLGFETKKNLIYKNTRDYYYDEYERERENDLIYSSSSNKTNRDDEGLQVLFFCVFDDALLSPSARRCRPSGTGDDVFLSSSRWSSSSRQGRRRRQSDSILIIVFEIIRGNRRQRRLPRRTSTKRANGFGEAFGGRFVPVGE